MNGRVAAWNAWVLMVLGLAASITGAELLVRGGSRLAARLGIPPIVVGVTVVSLGTSTPELPSASSPR